MLIFAGWNKVKYGPSRSGLPSGKKPLTKLNLPQTSLTNTVRSKKTRPHSAGFIYLQCRNYPPQCLKLYPNYGATIIANSPRSLSGFCLKYSIISCGLPSTTSSYIFVSSRATAMVRSGTYCCSEANVFSILCGDS